MSRTIPLLRIFFVSHASDDRGNKPLTLQIRLDNACYANLDNLQSIGYTMTPAKQRLAMASMDKPETRVSDLCVELGITRLTLYRHVSPDETLRPDGEKLLQKKKG